MIERASSSRVTYRVALIVAMAFAAWLFVLVVRFDGIEGTAWALLEDDTAFSTGYSAIGYAWIRMGMREGDIRRLLGEPIDVSWLYYDDVRWSPRAVVTSAGNVITHVRLHPSTPTTVAVGSSLDDVSRQLGVPDEVCWHYARSRAGLGETGKIRDVCFKNGLVQNLIHRFHVD